MNIQNKKKLKYQQNKRFTHLKQEIKHFYLNDFSLILKQYKRGQKFSFFLKFVGQMQLLSLVISPGVE